MSNGVYEVITNRIISALDQGVVPWRMTWHTSPPKSLISKKAYRGVNVFLLNAGRFTSSYFLTYRQAIAKGGQVKKGEHGTPVIFWKMFDGKKVGKNGKPEKAFVLRYYTVFNATQVEGLEYPMEQERAATFQPIEACQHIVDGYEDKGPIISYGGDRAAYLPALDAIQMPPQETFESAEAYYSTLFHEFTHSTGAKKRLDRDGITNFDKFGSHQYSFEELIAECGSSFLCGEAGILDTTIDNSVAYIQGWISKLRHEPTWIVQAGGKAAAAADYILGRSKSNTDEDEDI